MTITAFCGWPARGGTRHITKTLLVMKLTVFLLTAACLNVTARGVAQNVTFSGKNVSLEKVFSSIEVQTGYFFLYKENALIVAKPVTIEAENMPLAQFLDLVFKNQSLKYYLGSKTINVSSFSHPLSKPAGSAVVMYADQQPFPIKGRVVDSDGKPLAGASVSLRNGKNLGVTDAEGTFMINADDGDVFVISFVGYSGLSFQVRRSTSGAISGVVVSSDQQQSSFGTGDGNTAGGHYLKVGSLLPLGPEGFSFSLVNSTSKLDQVQIIGYGTTTQRMNTGSVVKITAEEISRQPVTNPLATIQGRATGVFVNTQNGMPGGNITVQIRGKGSINAGTDPLYIVDGVPFGSTPLNETFSTLSDGISGATSPLNSINPLDIASIEILKDADATAIYGSRAANGVIIITTKKGVKGKTKIDINLQSGISRLADLPKLLNLTQYLRLRYEGFQNSGVTPTVSNAPDLLVWDTTKSINWPKYMLGGTAHTTDVQTGISGGNEFTNFIISGNYRTEGTVLPGDQRYQRAGAHFMLQHSSMDRKFSADFSSSYTTDVNRQLPTSIFSVLTLSPNVPLYNNAGDYNWVGLSSINPAAVLRQKERSQTDNLLGNLVLRYWVLSNLQFKVNFGYTKIELDQVMTYPYVSLNPDFGSPSYAYYGNNNNKTYIVEPQLEYTKKINASQIQLLLGASWQSSKREGAFISGQNYSNDDLLEYVGAAGTISATNLDIAYKYASIFGRVHYDYRERYLLNVSVRRDGSSRFGPDKQFGNFGAVGAAWLFSKESFLDKFSFLSYGKLRASYGITGNDQISDYQYLSSYRTGENYQGVAGLTPARIANADFGWESNKKLEAAIELGLWKNRVLLTAAWYRNRSGNQLIDYPLPYTSGPFGSYQANLPALVENKGWELELNTTIIKNKNTSWSIYGNITLPENKLLKYPGLAASSFADTYVVGKDLSIKKAFSFTGVDPQTGLPEYNDINHDGFISAPEDWAIVGRTSPFLYGGFGSDFKLGQFQLNLFFQFSKQYAQGTATIPGTRSNKFDVALNRWQKPGDITTIPKAVVAVGDEYFNLAQSDAAFYNASYMRLKNVSISYQLPASIVNNLKFDSWRLYVEGQNLVTWRKQANLYDAETAVSGIAPFKSFVVGIQLTF